MPSTAHERSRTSRNFALPAAERCERPRQESWSAWSDQPGRLAQGPEEKWGDCGRSEGFMAAIPCRIDAPRWGGVSRRGTYAGGRDGSMTMLHCGRTALGY